MTTQPVALEETYLRMSVGRALLRMMEMCAQERWGALRIEGLDEKLWALPLEDLDSHDLHVLAGLCGGWWAWEDGPLFLSLEDWDERLRARSGDADADPEAGSVLSEALAGMERTLDEGGEGAAEGVAQGDALSGGLVSPGEDSDSGGALGGPEKELA